MTAFSFLLIECQKNRNQGGEIKATCLRQKRRNSPSSRGNIFNDSYGEKKRMEKGKHEVANRMCVKMQLGKNTRWNVNTSNKSDGSVARKLLLFMLSCCFLVFSLNANCERPFNRWQQKSSSFYCLRTEALEGFKWLVARRYVVVYYYDFWSID